MEVFKGKMALINLRSMFYMVTPNESSYEKLEDVPDYVDGATSYFLVLIALEAIVLKLQGRELPQFADSVNSVSHGILSLLSGLVVRAIELVVYVWVYNHFCLIHLPWNSSWVWFAAFVATDFLYYWFHRFGHEINLIWASHQVHHSSQEYNLTTALRQSAVQKYFGMIINLPMALFVPPSIYYVHVQFNLLYQFWIHTEAITSLGPLEFILNTPSHHRVHHGRNPYCIDKNYAGTLIIWDRIFNTFEKEGEKVTYGLVHPNQFWSPLYGQVFHFLYIFGLVKSYEGVGNKVSAVVKGPGWVPGSPWRGRHEDLPEVEKPEQKYTTTVPFYVSLYIGFHFILLNMFLSTIAPFKKTLPPELGITIAGYAILSLHSFGALYDKRSYASTLERVRCFLSMALMLMFKGRDMAEDPVAISVFLLFAASVYVWSIFIPMYEGDNDSNEEDTKKVQ